MASSSDSLLSGMNTLSSNVAANLKMMEELNSKAKEIMRKADFQAEHLLKYHKKYSENNKKECLSKIQAQFDESKELCDDKVQLSIQTYELVDKQIRMLDTELEKMKTNIENRSSLPPSKYTKIEPKTVKLFLETNKKASKSRKQPLEKKKSLAYGNLPCGNDFSKLSISSERKQCSLEIFNASPSAVDKDVNIDELLDTDMPVDPNEPIFCLCQQVSYGHMILCDDPNCSIEWFHFECVNLSKKPIGNWFCPNCSTKKKSK